MNRPSIVTLTVVAVALSLSACSQKTTRVEPEERAVVEPKPASQAPVEAVQKTPWHANKTVPELNDEAEERGFNPSIYFKTDQAELTPDARMKLAAPSSSSRTPR